MSDCDCQENDPIGDRDPEIEHPMTIVDVEDWLHITTVPATVVGIVFDLMTLE